MLLQHPKNSIEVVEEENKNRPKSHLLEWLRYWTGDRGGRFTAFFALLTFGHILYLYFHWGGDEFVEAVNDIVLVIAYFGAFLMILRTSRHSEHSTRARRAWLLIAFSYLGGTIGNALWGYFEIITKTQPFPSWADPFYLSYYIFMFWGLMMLAPEFQNRSERAKLTLDAGIVTLGGGMLIWYFILEPIAKAGTENNLLTALSLAYPVCDVVVLFAAMFLLLRRSSSINIGALNYLLTGILLFFFADLLFGYQNLNGTYQSGTVADSLYGLGSLATMAGSHYQYVKTERIENQAETSFGKKTNSFTWLPYLAIAAGYGMLLIFAFEQLDAVLNQLVIIAACLTLLVVSRQIISMRENEKSRIALAELHERFQGIYNASKDAIAFTTFEGALIDVNDAFLTLIGYRREELLNGTTYQKLTPPEYHRAEIERVNKIIELNRTVEFEKEYIRKDGSRVPIEITAFAVRGSGGDQIGLAAVVRDITERKRAEKEQARLNHQIETERRRLNNIISKVQGVVWERAITDDKTSQSLNFVSDYIETMLGYSPEEWLSTPNLWRAVAHPEDRERAERETQAIYESGKSGIVELRWIAKDGRVIWVESRKEVIYNDDEEPIGLRGVTIDITERKKLEQELRSSEESYRAFIQRSTEGIWRFEFDEPISTHLPVEEQMALADRYGFMAECNDAMARMYGADSAAGLRGKRLSDLLNLSDEANHKYFSAFIQSGYNLNDAESREMDGSGKDKYFLNNLVGVIEDGNLISAWGTQRDITERKEAEEKLKIFNRKLQQSNRELQDFAYVASHDLQEPLRKVQTFGERLQTKYGERLEGGGLDYLERMRNAAGRMQTLIQDLLSFSRVTTKAQPFVPVDLETVTREVLSDLEVKIEETGATVKIEPLPTIEADPSQMRQLIQNLVGNALKFHHKDIAPVIKICAQAGKINSNGNVAAGDLCQITIKDNGIGFDEKYLDKIFTVFQRLHGRAEYEGSGVGLAVCRKIVERHHGSITAHSAPGEGASFIITLPLTQSNTEVTNETK